MARIAFEAARIVYLSAGGLLGYRGFFQVIRSSDVTIDLTEVQRNPLGGVLFGRRITIRAGSHKIVQPRDARLRKEGLITG